MSKLAIHGGTPVRIQPFPAYNTIGEEEKAAVAKVLDSGILSRFVGSWHPNFHGGSNVVCLEREWASFFGAKHAIAVNSNTSGLFAAVVAAGVSTGDEVIVPPYTMSASAACILGAGAIPVFADIEAETFCIDPEEVEAKITPRTKAIVAVDLFGHPYDAQAIGELARKHGLTVIEDAAQAPMAKFCDRWAGTLGHIGVFSLNYHKHIHTGEGGIILTDDDRLAERLQLIRNHGEAVVEAKGAVDSYDIVGGNHRMTEIEAAIGREQLKKLPSIMEPWVRVAVEMTEFLAGFTGVTPPVVKEGCRHAYYVHASKWNAEVTGVSRNRFMEALRAELPYTLGRRSEGALISSGFTPPLYMQPIYQRLPQRAAYRKGICPITERMHETELFAHEYMKPSMSQRDRQAFYDAFEKVYEARHTLR